MSAVRLPVLTLAVRQQRYSCHGCGNCCRDFTVQLRDDDILRLREQGWEEKLGEPVTIEFRGTTFLRQRDDGSCIFLLDDGRCRIHGDFGFAEKPLACQLFPFHLVPTDRGVGVGINFACQSVQENRGAELPTHDAELRRFTASLPELHGAAGPPLLDRARRAEPREPRDLARRIDRWLLAGNEPWPVRIDGLAWVSSSLAAANLEAVRGDRFADLLDVLFGALPEELAFHPIDPATGPQRRMLRQGVFSRTEDPRLAEIGRRGRTRFILGQLRRSRRFRVGRGVAPTIGAGWPESVEMAAVERVGPAGAPDADSIDDLVTRYLRAVVLGHRAWGNGYYGWSMVDGLAALMINVAAIGWLARLHAAGRSRDAIDLPAVQAALGRVDRTAGRARWLGSAAERLRVAFLHRDEGLRRLLDAYALIG
jgi:lysine-N-methylase